MALASRDLIISCLVGFASARDTQHARQTIEEMWDEINSNYGMFESE